jgi:transcriptional regulator with XRE-family HTH domain
MATGEQLRAERRAADLTLAEVARLGGVSAGHLSRVELGEREVTPATVVLYQRAIAQKTGTAPSPTVDAVRRRDMFALAALPAAVPLAQPRQLDLDECAQWLAWETWQSGADALPATDVPGDRKRAVAELLARRYLVRDRNGALRFPTSGMLDFYLAAVVFNSISSGSSTRLATAQTTHATDLVLAQFASDDADSMANLGRWMTGGSTPVLRVNAAGVLAKMNAAETTDSVVVALRSDHAARALYLAAVASRVLRISWSDAARVATGSPISGDGIEALAGELRNPRDAAARWCSAVLIHQAGAANRANVIAAVADALGSERSAENLRTMAALAAGADPITV